MNKHWETLLAMPRNGRNHLHFHPSGSITQLEGKGLKKMEVGSCAGLGMRGRRGCTENRTMSFRVFLIRERI